MKGVDLIKMYIEDKSYKIDVKVFRILSIL